MKTEKFQAGPASLYTLENNSGVKAVLTDIGASVVDLFVPAKDGGSVDICLGYDSAERYFNNNSAYGTIVGRFANRIGGAAFTLNGNTYQLDKNEGKNVLHGGFDAYFRRLWAAEVLADNSVRFTLNSPDGDQGMPGNAEVSVTYTLSENNELILDYYAVSDKDTVFNITSHCYYNLDGHDAGYIGDHMLYLDCDCIAAIDSEFIPTGEILDIRKTAMDFTSAKPIGQDISSDMEQMKLGNGYDHNYVLNAPGFEKPFAVVRSPKTGVVMELYTDLPGVQFYSGNNMGTDFGEKGGKYELRGGFCLETQYFPDTPNHPNFPSCVYEAGKAFVSRTVWKFSVEN
ncbi:MAG: aldose epimerase family protein [Eubacteriales bacterium]|nr:aldose epimerase family protein [Eubacteriales bacterium]